MSVRSTPTFLSHLLFLLCIFWGSSVLFAQDRFARERAQIKPTTTAIKIDGKLDEDVWKEHYVGSNFWQHFPGDTIQAKAQTELYMTYDDKYVYVAARCYSEGNNYVIPSNRRDYRAGGNDNISFVFDTFQDKTNAFIFGLNPLGVQREALISNGGADPVFFNMFWDNKWDGESTIGDNYWIAEARIPFKTLRFIDGGMEWNFNCYRFDTQTNEQSSWVRIPQNQIIMSLAFVSPLEFVKPLRKPGPNIAIIPYLRSGQTTDFLKEPTARTPLHTAGVDLKVGITPGLILDATINPDFSTVEADRQVQNLTRFDISLAFPEQRQFFLENSDLFGTSGSQETIVPGFPNPNFTPFYSRRVGLEIDNNTGTYTPTRILSGLRLNGKLSNTMRLGVLNVQTARDEARGISDINTTVAVVQQKLFSRSNITALFMNKELFNALPGQARYNRVGGLEYNLASSDNRWIGKLYYHQSFSPNEGKGRQATGGSLIRNMYRYQAVLNYFWIGEGFEAEIGVVPRRNVFRFNPRFLVNRYPASRFINRYNVGVTYEEYRQPGLGLTDQSVGMLGEVNFQDNGRFNWQLTNTYTYLFADFDPTRSGIEPLRRGTSYRYTNAQMRYLSDQRRVLNLEATAIVGQNFDGQIASLTGALLYRFQPYGTLTMNFSYSYLTSSKGESNLFLIGPRTDITFTKSLFWTTFFQYNNLTNNINLNSRLQWRFKPVSDFFLVYSDNYFADNFAVKNRAIIAKLSYWFNV